MPTMRETTVWSPTLATRMRRLPLLTTVPAKTSSPAVFSAGSNSPVMALWSMTAAPEMIAPSMASFSPVCASTSSPGRILSMGQRSTRPSGSTFQAFSSSTESIFLMEERVRSMV